MKAQCVGLARGTRRGLRPSDEALATGAQPPFGAHIVTPRRTYTHHGIYVGQQRVVPYGGLGRALRRGPVEEVSLSEFALGRGMGPYFRLNLA
jgi:hypothetical protein